MGSTGSTELAKATSGRNTLADGDSAGGQEGAVPLFSRPEGQTQLVSRDLDRQGQYGGHQRER